MPSLPLLVSLIVARAREQNANATGPEEVVPDDIRIDMDGTDKPHHTQEKHQETAKEDCSIADDRSPHSRTFAHTIKHGLHLFRRVFHVTRVFIFQSDKTLEEGYSPSYRYLPIVSGVVVPFSILLEIPGLTWYVRTYGTQVLEYRENPAVLNAGLALSMASAVLANICLIIRFLERRIKSATVAAICFLLIHDLINITALAIFGIAHRHDDGFTYSQAYWITFASTITSLIVTVTLLIDYKRTRDFATSGSGLTRKQRSLVIIVMILLSYFGLGALVNCFLLKQKFLDGLYFVVCSCLTIGFGDIAPDSTGAQVFCIFFNTFGILNTGVAIAIARETVVESFQQSYRNRKHALSVRRRLHRAFHTQNHEKGTNHFLPADIASTVVAAMTGNVSHRHHNKEPNGIEGSPESKTVNGTEVIEEKANTRNGAEILGLKLGQNWDEEQEEYTKFRQEMVKEEKKEFRAKLIVSWSLFAVFWILGGVIFMLSERWSYGTAFYFCFIAFSTIGYGDIAPKTGPGRVCFIAWSLMGVGTMTILVSVLSEAYQTQYSTAIHNGLFDKTIRNYHARNQASGGPTTSGDDEERPGLVRKMSVQERRDVLEETKAELVELPQRIIGQARALHSNLQYVLTHSHSQEKPPPALQRALDEMLEDEAMNDALKKDIFQDEDARRTLYMMSFERSLKQMVESADKVSKLMENREMLEKELGIEAYEDDLEDDEEKAELLEDADQEEVRKPRSKKKKIIRDPSKPRARDSSVMDREETGGSKSRGIHWLKLRAGLLASSHASRPHFNRGTTYLHERGSASDPHLNSIIQEPGTSTMKPEVGQRWKASQWPDNNKDEN